MAKAGFHAGDYNFWKGLAAAAIALAIIFSFKWWWRKRISSALARSISDAIDSE